MGRFDLIFRPNKKGFEKILGELENEIMEIVWQRGEANVRDVFEDLNQKRPLAYTTVLSTMRNLNRKGFLRRSKSGVAHLYSASCSRDEMARLVVNEVVNGLMDDFGQPFIACLVDLDEKKDLVKITERLEKLLDENAGD
jgi:predicted transcriptional regulator